MTHRRPKKTSRSLADLGQLMDNRSQSPSAPKEAVKPAEPAAAQAQGQETDLFAEAMADVKPLDSDVYWQPPPKKPKGKASLPGEDPVRSALQRLIDKGEGFRVADTPEYMEAAGPGVDRTLLRRLHQGRYAIQGHLDLHGLTSAEAEQVLSQFIHTALTTGKRMVLVIHGRGLTSPDQPVLKNMVYRWLTRGPLRRYVLAFTSARACDGGAGATYVLLRKQPWKKKKGKNR